MSGASLCAREAVELRIPLFFVVEPDPYWADARLRELLEAAQGDDDRVVARWSRAGGWSELGAMMGHFAPAGRSGSPDAYAAADPVVAVVDLADRLASARVGHGDLTGSPLRRAVFWLRGADDELKWAILRDALFDVAEPLRRWGASLAVELRAAPRAGHPARPLGPLVTLRPAGAERHARHARDFLAAVPPGPGTPSPAAVMDILGDLPQSHAAAAVRLAEMRLGAGGGDPLACLRAACDAVRASP